MNSQELYLYYHNVCSHQISQGADILWGDPTLEFTWILNEVVLWGHIISPLAEDPRTVMLTYHEKFPPLKPHDPLITLRTRGHKTVWKIYISTFLRLMTFSSQREFTCLTESYSQTSITSFEKCFWHVSQKYIFPLKGVIRQCSSEVKISYFWSRKSLTLFL